MLSVRHLTKVYKIKGKEGKEVKALDDVSIDFPEKGMVFLLGKSGSGKSTLLNTMGGLDSFDSGEIIIKGKSSKQFKQKDFDAYRNTFIGFIFQEYNILEEFSVGKNLALALELQGKIANKENVDALLKQVDLDGYYKRKPNQLSGGQKQRVAIARALIKNPEIIMADEPTGALDSNTGKQVMDTLKKLSQNKLVIIVSHDREFAEIYGDRIIELKDGKIIKDSTKKTVEAQKSASGISYIDDKIIHIKKGQKITKEDYIHIIQMMQKNTQTQDTIISFDQKPNDEIKKIAFITDDGNKKIFKNTTNEDVKLKKYNPNEFKLIDSKLKQKDAFKIGVSSLKHKPIRLVITILLSFIAFAMFGLVDTIASFDIATSTYQSIRQLDLKTLSFESLTTYGDNATPTKANFKDSDVKDLEKAHPNYTFYKVINASKFFQFLGTDIQYNHQNSTNYLHSDSSISGFLPINENIATKLNLTLVEGSYPTTNDEICISQNIFNTIKFKYKNINSLADINTYKFSIDDLIYKVVGIVQDDTDISKYQKNNTAGNNPNLQEYINYSEIHTILRYGLVNMCYVKQSHYNELAFKNLSEYDYLLTRLNQTNSDQKLVSYLVNYNQNNKAFTVQFAAKSTLDNFSYSFHSMSKVFLYVGLGLAIFASLMLMNFISTSISYKRREIGILRAIGAGKKDVFNIFFSESFIIAIINFVLATIACIIAAHFINESLYNDLNLSISLLNFGVRQLILLLAISILVAAISTFLPVWKIAKKNPVDSINNR